MSYGNNNGYGNRQGSSGYRGNAGGGGNRQFASRSQGAGQGQGQRKDNTGRFQPNQNMSGPNSPHFKGSAMISGRMYYMSVWDNTDRESGVQYFKVGFTPIEEANQSRPQSAPSRGAPQRQGNFGEDMDLDDQVPF